ATYLVIITGILLALIGILTMTPFLKLMGASGESLAFGENYLRIALLGSIFWIGGIGYNMIIRAEGKMGTAAWMMGLGLLINVIANYIFMAILDLGVEGAAWGTNIGMFVYILLFFLYCFKGKASFQANPKKIYRDKEIKKEILSLGFPSFLMTIMTVIKE
ncbi:MAG: polysaccharide biosynthesis C-terminal domain-containing protein, partial [Tissierellia bacterium]|nr:polysaccharide biosynthesis C-terminal domain-containing protein [Tissierellia bacterium]